MLNVQESVIREYQGEEADGGRESTQGCRSGVPSDCSHQKHASILNLDNFKPARRRLDIPHPVRSAPSRPRTVTSEDLHLRWQTHTDSLLRRPPSQQIGRVTGHTGKQPSGRHSMITGHAAYGRPTDERNRQTDSPSRFSCQRQQLRNLSSGRDMRQVQLEGRSPVGATTCLRRHVQHGSVVRLSDTHHCRPRSNSSEIRNEKVQSRINTIRTLENVRLWRRIKIVTSIINALPKRWADLVLTQAIQP